MNIREEEIKRICSPVIYKRGLEYFKDGRVHIKSRDDSTISALVDGEERYGVKITFDGDKITSSICTCPYYHTMASNCKHIVAVLKKRQAELIKKTDFKDENDRLAQALCKDFADSCFEKKRLNLKFSLNINTVSDNECDFYISLKCGFDDMKFIDSVDRFMDSYANMSDFKLSKHTTINSSDYSLSENEKNIMGILCEAHENKLSSGSYVPRVSQTKISSLSAKRLLPLLIAGDHEFLLNSIPVTDMLVLEDNPDIVIDINATDSEISLNAFESGFSLFKDGSWFFYEGSLYHTTPDWRSWFMPIYNTLMSQSRTRIDFKGNSRIDFATYVYPKLRNKQGVVTTGIDSMVINVEPQFYVYLDYINNTLSAVIEARYGKLTLKLPQDTPNSGMIVIRDLAKEDEVISQFNKFNLSGDGFSSSDDDVIFDFIYNVLGELKEKTSVYTSKNVDTLIKGKTADVSLQVTYKNDVDLLEIGFETSLSTEEIRGILKAVKLNKGYYKFKDGGFFIIDEKNSRDFKLLESLNFSEKDISKKHKEISKYYLLYLDALKKEDRVSSDKAFDNLVKSIKSIKADIPKDINAVLRNYQKDGVLWMKQLSSMGFGGILADDMGLGKTLEVIAFVMSEKKEKPALVIAPSSLTYNWIREIEKFAPDARAKVVDGTKEERDASLSDISGYDFIITSYPLIRRDIDTYSKLEFSYMFCDESQHIKNPDTMSAKAVKKINASVKFALSGTPIENRLTELWSVFDMIMKGYLYSKKDFEKIFEKQISSDGEGSVLDDLRKKISPFILRRMKSDVLSELPEKIENTIYSEFVPEQKKLYEAFHAVAKNEISAIIGEGNAQMQVLTLLLRLRQICCHPALFDKNYKKDSGKLILLEEIIDSAISQGHRILVFSQFTSMLDIIKSRLSASGKDCFFIDGKTPAHLRSALCERFNNGEKDIFLISLKAGGTGLNLTGADTVILYDPWWNPAVMEQASDRAYRIGQKKAVQVIRLASKGTIEEQILKLQQNKKNLAKNVIQKNERTISGFTKEEILSLFE